LILLFIAVAFSLVKTQALTVGSLAVVSPRPNIYFYSATLMMTQALTG